MPDAKQNLWKITNCACETETVSDTDSIEVVVCVCVFFLFVSRCTVCDHFFRQLPQHAVRTPTIKGVTTHLPLSRTCTKCLASMGLGPSLSPPRLGAHTLHTVTHLLWFIAQSSTRRAIAQVTKHSRSYFVHIGRTERAV